MLPQAILLALALSPPGDPLVYEVPRGGVSLESQRRPLFFAAPFVVRGGRLTRGAWTDSDEILGPGPTRVVVVASWCPACHRLLELLSAQRPQTTVILFVEDERRTSRGEPALANPASLERYPLAFHFVRAGSDLARVTSFPTTFVCSRTRCRPEGWRGR